MRCASSVQALQLGVQVTSWSDELRLGLSCCSSDVDIACVSTCCACPLHGSISCQSEVMGHRATLGSPSRLRYCLTLLAADELSIRLQHEPSAGSASNACTGQALQVVTQAEALSHELQLGLSWLSSDVDLACMSTCTACSLHEGTLPLEKLHWIQAHSADLHSFTLSCWSQQDALRKQ